MSIQKPSDAEDEYFRREELERLARLRKQLDARRAAVKADQERASHWMRCPKCGGAMEETPLRHVIVDTCKTCGYVGFDAGELELLLGHRENVLARLVDEVRRIFTIGRAPQDPLLREVIEGDGKRD